MLILVRHGRTSLNARSLLQGHIDVPLDDVGRDQARRVAEAVTASCEVARVVSSPLQRAKQTADAFGCPVEVDERFIELNYGEFDGLAMSDVPHDVWRKWRSDENFRPTGGESLNELDARVHGALVELSVEAQDRDVVVVSHVSPIKSAVVWALGGDPSMTWRCSLDRASVTRIGFGANGPSLMSFNETGHLGELK